ncbi:MAG: hypothetical protein AAF911_01265 [Planctomycetota bacterium]
MTTSTGRAVVRAVGLSAALLWTGSSFAQVDDRPDRVSWVVEDDRSVAVHAVVDENLDLATRLVRSEGELAQPLTALASKMVVGQGEHRTNRTLVRVLNRYGLTEAQFLAFSPSVSGGVRVAAGRDADGRVILAATPASTRGGVSGEVRLFSEAGGLRDSLVVDPGGGGALLIQAGDFYPERPGDELAITSERTNASGATVKFFGFNAEEIGEIKVEADRNQTLTLSAESDQQGHSTLYVHARPGHAFFTIHADRDEVTARQLPDLPPTQSVYPSAFGRNNILAVGDGEVRSLMTRIASSDQTAEIDAGLFENQFWIVPGDWSESNKGGPYVQMGDLYGHFRMDLGNPAINQPELWDQPDVWPRIEKRTVQAWGPLLRPLDQQPLRMWEPTITHRMNWDRALPWANRNDPETGLPRFHSLTNKDVKTSYGEFGKQNQFHVFTYAYGDTALDQLYAVPLQQFLRRLAVRFRAHPERVFSMEPLHEHEISVGVAGSVGDYHPLMITGFRDYLRRLYGDDAALRKRFRLTGRAFDAPRNAGRGAWDRYEVNNPFYAEWLKFQRYVVNRRIADGFYAALAAGFPPEIIKSHQIPDSFAVGSTATFSDRKARFTPVDYTLTAGVGFGYTRYGVWFKKPRNMLKSALSSGFASIAMGEYQSLTPNAELAYQQLVHLFENGVNSIHVMHWPASADKGFNAAMKKALARFLERQQPRPGVAGGVGKVVATRIGDQPVDIAVIGTGANRTGLLKSLRADGSWQGAVYSVPFRSAIVTTKLRSRAGRGEDGGRRIETPLQEFDVAQSVEITFSGTAPAGSEVTWSVTRDGQELPGYGRPLPTSTDQARHYRIVLRNQLPSDGLSVVVNLPDGFREEQRHDARLHTERVARMHRDDFEGEAHRGSIDFALIPKERP